MSGSRPLPAFNPRYLYLEKHSCMEPLASSTRNRFPDAEVYEIEDHRRLSDTAVPLKGYTPEMKRNVVVLARNPGTFIREFQGATLATERKSYYIAHANGCPFDCQYCFLQCYFSHGAPVLFANQEDLFNELSRHLRGAHEGTRYHAGELSDALALEALSGFAARAVPVFREYPRAVLELRTKSAHVASVLPRDPPGNVVVSWTLIPDRIAMQFEQGTPPVEERIKEAVRCQRLGYTIGIRLDPIIHAEGWRQGYADLIDMIFAALECRCIDSFVLGGFRYVPALAARIRSRFPESTLLVNEFSLSGDGKFRYFRPLRVELYRAVISQVRERSLSVPIALCMETDQVWKDLRDLLERRS